VITDILALEDRVTLDAEVIVVGSGIAGAELGTFLARHGVSVLMLESGRESFDPAIEALNEVHFSAKPHRRMDPDANYHPYLPPELRGVSRVRQFGGTSNVWTGKWKYLQESDFPGRPWVADSAWPIRFAELLEHYRSAARDYGFGDLEAEAERAEIRELRRRLAAGGLKMSSFYWEKQPTRTRHRFGDEMRASEGLRAVLGATVTELELELDGDRRRVTSVACRSLEGRRLTARAEIVILATGALEAPRLLLASDRQVAGGIGNAHDLVGRFYTDHPKHHSGLLYPGPLTRRFANELQYAPKPRFCICFALDDATQARHELLEHVIYLKPIYETRTQAARRWLSRRPACRDGNGVVAAYRVKFVNEQAPNRESRVTLSGTRDALGMRRIDLAWRFTAQDHASLRKAVELVAERFPAVGLGELDFGDRPPSIETMTDAAHQMGTTRMADDPTRGVTDLNCRVFGADNLYVAGSAVFPTGPSYSPTFTILALARRLGLHVLARRRAGARPPLVLEPSGTTAGSGGTSPTL
jgi:choline dehydrogenase-like flavoprotein